MHLDLLTLTYISQSIDFVNFLRQSFVLSVSVIAVSVQPCIVTVLDIPFKQAPGPADLDLYFTVH